MTLCAPPQYSNKHLHALDTARRAWQRNNCYLGDAALRLKQWVAYDMCVRRAAPAAPPPPTADVAGTAVPHCAR